MEEKNMLEKFEIIFCDFESLIKNDRLINFVEKKSKEVKIYITIRDYQALVDLSKINSENNYKAKRMISIIRCNENVKVYIPYHVNEKKNNCENVEFITMVMNIMKRSNKKGVVVSKQKNLKNDLALVKIPILN